MYLILEIIQVGPIIRGIKRRALDLASWELKHIV
jgi:hypothetical protein